MSCCPNPFIVYGNNGKWSCENCGDDPSKEPEEKSDIFWNPYMPKPPKQCTCGSDKVHGKDNNHHVDWCDKKKG